MELFAHEIEGYRNAATRAERTKIVRQAAAARQCSADVIYRALKEAGAAKARKARADKTGAASKKNISAAKLNDIVGLVLKSRGGKGRYEMPITIAVKVAEEAGWIGEKEISATTLARWMKQNGKEKKHLERRAEKPAHINVKTERPNQLWQFDASVCRQQYLYPDGKWEIEDNAVIYQNKPEKVRRAYDGKVCRFIRYVATDHCSGLVMVAYDLAPSEDQLAACCVLARFFQERGVPEKLLSDQGLFGREETPSMVRLFLSAIGVECITHTPGHPWAKGSVENGHNVWEKYFESRLVNAPARVLEDLTQRAAHHVELLNGQERHRRHGMTRETVYAMLPAEQRRPAPPLDVCWDLFTARPESRIVGEDLSIQYRGKLWRTAATDLRGRKVLVRPSSVSAEEIYISEEDKPQIIHVGKYVARDVFGFAEDAKTLDHKNTPTVDAFLKGVEEIKRANAEKAIAACAGPAAMTEAPAKVIRGVFGGEDNDNKDIKDGKDNNERDWFKPASDAAPMMIPATAIPPTKLISAMDARSRALDELAPLSAEEKAELDLVLVGGGEIAETKVREWIAGRHAARAASFADGERKQA